MKDFRYLFNQLVIGIILFTTSLFAQVENIAGGFSFVEGPVWKDGLGLLFSDIPANRVYLWSPDSGVSTYLNPSGNSNGLTFDSQGRLLLAQTGLRRIALLEPDGTQISLADTFNGKKLNSPNDLAVKSDGSIFFTDPPFNIPAGQQQELSFSGIYRISPYGELQLLDSTLNLPNGICFSPDETKLYVNNSQARIIYVWDVIDDSTIANKREFARINPNGYADGMKVDMNGNLFCTAPLGVWVFSPEGIVLDTILVPGQTSNCNWGDEDKRTLYITAGNNVYRYRLPATGVENEGVLPEGFKLYQNYPNPFNPETKIKFTLPDVGTRHAVSLRIYDILGREVITLINEERNAGEYEVEFSTKGGSAFGGNTLELSSGIYFYQLQVRNPQLGLGYILEKTMKMQLIK
jgi:sugar lactone lactonase YvrE